MNTEFDTILQILEDGGNPSDYIQNGGGLTSITTDTKVEKYRNSTSRLPTAGEYSEAAQKSAFQFTSQWSEPKYQCPNCGGGMCKNMMVVLTSYPPKYEYQCDKCGYIDYQYM